MNANLSEHHPKAVTRFFDGPFTDYMPQWYLDVGLKITQTLFIQSFMPIVGVCVGFGVPKVKQLLNNKFTGNQYITKSTSMAKYKAIYGGPEYLVHFKFSELLNVSFVAMMYGLGMPLLFPLAALGLFSAYVAERIALAFIARQPPAMDDALTQNCLDMIKYAPLFLLCNGYWMIGNKQIFANKWTYIEHDLQTMKSDHFVWPVEVSWAAPLLYMAATGILMIIL